MTNSGKRVHLIIDLMIAPLFLCVACGRNANSYQRLPVLTVDASLVTGPISPFIYGSNEDDWSKSGKYLTFGRQGGNRMTAYNWENNASNAGSDWHNQSDNYLGGGDIPGEVPRKAVADALKHGASFLVTIPMAGYVAADKRGDGDVNQTPNYLKTRFKISVPKKNAPFVYPPNLNDGYVYQDEFVSWLEKTFPSRPPGANIWYSLDNEPDLWSETHSRIHPEKATYAEIMDKSVAMATAIKAVAPKTLIFGPASYGWEGFVHFQDPPDANGRDFIEYYLAGMKNAGMDAGQRLLDVLDLHWYPEAMGNNKRITENDVTPPVAKARMQATRSLWDPTYVEDSWITQKSTGGQPIDLIPRMMNKIKRFYPGTKLAFTEYQFGAPGDISGAIAEADALGIFGRTGVFAAAMWPYGGDESFVHAAFDIYRNYDGNGGAFGDGALRAVSPDPSEVSIYASKASKGGRVVCVLINQTDSTRDYKLDIAAMPTHSNRQFTLAGNKAQVVPAHFAEMVGDDLMVHLAPKSISVLELN